MDNKCVCRRPVKVGVQCSGCLRRFHMRCCNVTREEVSGGQSWHCIFCKHSKIVREKEELIQKLQSELNLAIKELQTLKAVNCSKNNFKKSDNNWITVKPGKGFRKSYLSKSLDSLVVSNRFSILEKQDSSPTLESEKQPAQLLNQVQDNYLGSKIKKTNKRKVLILGSSHGRDIAGLLKTSLGNNYEVSGICKPNARLCDVVSDLKSLGENMDKQDHIIIVGGPGNSLSCNLDYKIEEDIDNIAKCTGHTNVGFVPLFRRWDQPWMNHAVRQVNADLVQLLSSPGRSHMNVVNVHCIGRNHHTNHGLHLNAGGKMVLAHQIANSIRCDQGTDARPIPVISGVFARPFLG